MKDPNMKCFGSLKDKKEEKCRLRKRVNVELTDAEI